MLSARGVLVTGSFALLVAALVASTSAMRAASPSSSSASSAPERVVSLSRQVCFGMCPIYDVTLFDDGTLTYEGKEYVKIVGSKTKRLDRATIARVKKALRDSGIHALDVHCCDCQDMTDHPTAVIGFAAGGQWKTIVDYHGCGKTPRPVRELEETLDTLLGTAEFVGTMEERTRSPRR